MHRAQVIEAFHLAFLAVLRTRLDPSRYVLKGGANLRYFFDSVLHSEDMDLDVAGVEGWALREKVDDVLASPPLQMTLRSTGLGVLTEEITRPQQTNTTRRWRVPLTASGHTDPVRTKIEFSNRNGEHRLALEFVPDRVVAPYALRPPSVQHYLAEPAIEQKVLALAGRSETQARDVFDLDLLLRKAKLAPGAVSAKKRRAAAERGFELPFEAFEDQIKPFLEPEIVALYDRSAWEQMQLFVAERLLAEDADED